MRFTNKTISRCHVWVLFDGFQRLLGFVITRNYLYLFIYLYVCFKYLSVRFLLAIFPLWSQPVLSPLTPPLLCSSSLHFSRHHLMATVLLRKIFLNYFASVDVWKLFSNCRVKEIWMEEDWEGRGWKITKE